MATVTVIWDDPRVTTSTFDLPGPVKLSMDHADTKYRLEAADGRRLFLKHNAVACLDIEETAEERDAKVEQDLTSQLRRLETELDGLARRVDLELTVESFVPRRRARRWPRRRTAKLVGRLRPDQRSAA